jgi:hypothetical protein
MLPKPQKYLANAADCTAAVNNLNNKLEVCDLDRVDSEEGGNKLLRNAQKFTSRHGVLTHINEFR